jgi:hypothetical protein
MPHVSPSSWLTEIRIKHRKPPTLGLDDTLTWPKTRARPSPSAYIAGTEGSQPFPPERPFPSVSGASAAPGLPDVNRAWGTRMDDATASFNTWAEKIARTSFRRVAEQNYVDSDHPYLVWHFSPPVTAASARERGRLPQVHQVTALTREKSILPNGPRFRRIIHACNGSPTRWRGLSGVFVCPR